MDAGSQKQLHAELMRILELHPDGIGEYELMIELAGAGFQRFERERLRARLELFRAHFVLFNSLYQLRARLLRDEAGHLEISALTIRYCPGVLASNQPATSVHDPMQEYYSDLQNLHSTTDIDVSELLDSFWKKFPSISKRAEALAVLGLSDPVDRDAIQRRYRQLALACHPDHTGDPERLRELNAAMQLLRS